MEKLRSDIEATINANKDRINNVSKEIWSNPESSLKETKAHKLLTDFLSEEGFEVETQFLRDTGFRAVYSDLQFHESTAAEAAKDGGGDAPCSPNVCFFCEYDAVADVGHAAGHNLKTAGSLAAAVAIKKLIKSGNLAGTVTVLGTPGEDSGEGTKIDMLEAQVFTGIDFCLMLSPLNFTILYPKHYALLVVSVNYKGKSAHASAFPWEGRNALDAAVACYNNVGLLRQQLKPNMSINGVILNGGTQANVIPANAEMKFWLRAPDHAELCLLKAKCTACFVAAAKATGCEVDFQFEDKVYNPTDHNLKLGELFAGHAEYYGIQFTEDYGATNSHTGSSDMGNVSQMIPCLSPTYDVGTHANIHSEMFHDACGSPEAHERTLQAAKAMACTAAEVLNDPVLMNKVREATGDSGSSNSEVLRRMSSISSESDLQ